MEKVVIRTQGLVKDYGKNRVVDGVSIEVSTGEIVGLLGPNGAGKTTVFKMVVGFTKPTGGSVFFDKEDISSLPLYLRARKGIGYLAQETSVFRKMTVRENLKAILEAHGVPRAEIRKRIEVLTEELGIGHLERQTAETLSGGEKRRVEIARALTTQPKFLLLDEPFTGIDPPTIEDIQGIIRRLSQRGLGVLITDHNVRETLYVVDRSYLMFDGKVVVSGTMKDIAENQEVRDRYITDRIVRDLGTEEKARAEAAK